MRTAILPRENFQDRERNKEGGTEQRVEFICKEGENHYKSKFTIWGIPLREN